MPGEILQASEFRLLRDYIEKHCGIALGEEKAYLVETRLLGLLAEMGCTDFGTFYRLASTECGTTLRDKIVDAMTTNETLWFRDGHPYTILREVLLPELSKQLKDGSRFRIRIWSAASSTGQEPYSIAMSVLEHCRLSTGLRPDQFEILATDISPSALFLAQSGRYDSSAMSRGMPDDLRSRYFREEKGTWVINDEVKNLVTFRKFNLQDSIESLGRFDIVFCRYVTIYFSDEFKRQIYSGLAKVLAPDGHLIISAVESLNGFSTAFNPLSHGSGTYFQCKPIFG
jgi:chemotaxis protein methyltransferase CheR